MTLARAPIDEAILPFAKRREGARGPINNIPRVRISEAMPQALHPGALASRCAKFANTLSDMGSCCSPARATKPSLLGCLRRASPDELLGSRRRFDAFHKRISGNC